MIIFYHDPKANFYPLDLFRHQADLLIGTKPFGKRTKGVYLLPDRLEFIYSKPTFKGSCLYLKATAIFKEKVSARGKQVVLKNKKGDVVGFRVKKKPYPKTPEEIKECISGIKKKKVVKAIDFNYPWEILANNGEMIVDDFKKYRKKSMSGKIDKKAVVVGKNIIVKRGARVDPGVVINTDEGPVIIDRKAWIKAGSIVEGPAYIGVETVIDKAKITSGTSIGRNCRIGGEIEASIILGYTNKHHDGFLGHSYLGSWINLGALTTNSDLKNNYHKVCIRYKDQQYDTGLLKVGCFIGDHTKTGIGTLIPTGCIIGAFTNIYGGGMIENCIPSFSWGTPGSYDTYDFKEALDTAKTVMTRRGIRLTKAYERVIREVRKLET